MLPCPPPDPHPKSPRLQAPPGTCDAHFHVFGPAALYPFAAERSYTPPEAPVAAYQRVLAGLGIERCVIVQPSVYGTDNSCTLAAMAQLGRRCRGVAVVDERVTAIEIERLHRLGVRGVRFNLAFKGGARVDALEAVAERIRAFGWHLQLLTDGRGLLELAPRLRRLAVDLVVDHMGYAPVAAGLGHPAIQALLALVGEGRCWVKLSGAYRVSVEGPPYADVAPLARALIAAAPERMVWGTDWPHPGFAGAMPNDGDLLDLVAEWALDPALRRRILAENAAELYGF